MYCERRRRPTNQLISQLVEPMADAGTGKEVVKVEAGDAYIFDGHESHYLKGGPDGAHIVCIFTPACTGMEVSSKKQNFFLLSLLHSCHVLGMKNPIYHQNLHLMHIFDVHLKITSFFRKPKKMVRFHCWSNKRNPVIFSLVFG